MVLNFLKMGRIRLKVYLEKGGNHGQNEVGLICGGTDQLCEGCQDEPQAILIGLSDGDHGFCAKCLSKMVEGCLKKPPTDSNTGVKSGFKSHGRES
jgi:hypothetical protein